MMRAITRRFTWPLAALLLAGCAYHHKVPPLSQDGRASVRALSVEIAYVDNEPTIKQPISGKGRAALAGAGVSVVGGILGGYHAALLTLNPYGLVIGPAIGVAAAPFVAAGMAIAAPSTEDAREANDEIVRAIRTTEWGALLEAEMKQALAELGRSDSLEEAARLRLSLDGPWLVLDVFDAVPALTVRGELARGQTCLLDRRWRWHGDDENFVDLGENEAAEYRARMGEGIALIAEAIVADLFVADAPRRTEYRSKRSFRAGDRPLQVVKPTEHVNLIGSWDKTENDMKLEPPCSGLLANSTQDESTSCRLPACRAAGAWPIGEI